MAGSIGAVSPAAGTGAAPVPEFHGCAVFQVSGMQSAQDGQVAAAGARALG